MTRLVMVVALGALAALPAAGQQLDTIEFFKKAAGIWNGKGTSEVGPQKTPLGVEDVWIGQFGKDGMVFVQSGRISLSNGATFGYRWVYRYDDGKLLGQYKDTNDQTGLYAVELGEDKKTLSVQPLAADKTPLKAGLFSKVTLEGGKYSYRAEIRGDDGKATVRTIVVCVPKPAEEKPPGKKEPEKGN